MGWQKIPKEHHPFFYAAVPQDDRVITRQMFGGVAAMANGHMFGGLWADTVCVKLPAPRRATVLKRGGSTFAPMGRPMADMVLLPPEVLRETAELSEWLAEGLTYAMSLPEKKKKAKPAKKAAVKKAAVKKKAVKKKAVKKKAVKKKAVKKKAVKKKAVKKKAVKKKAVKKKAS